MISGFELNADGVVIAILVCYVFFGSFFVYYHIKEIYQKFLKFAHARGLIK